MQDAFWAVLSFLFSYGIALPALILLYPTTQWARTAVNSGFFRFRLLHRTIIGTNWRGGGYSRKPRCSHPVTCRSGSTSRNPAYPVAAHDPRDRVRRRRRRPATVVRGPAARPRSRPSGTGKSVLLRKIAHDAAELFLARRPDVLPLLVDFRTSPISGRSLRDLIRDRLKRAEVKLPNATLDHLIDEGGFLILADSLNEAAGDELKKQLKAERHFRKALEIADTHPNVVYCTFNAGFTISRTA